MLPCNYHTRNKKKLYLTHSVVHISHAMNGEYHNSSIKWLMPYQHRRSYTVSLCVRVFTSRGVSCDDAKRSVSLCVRVFTSHCVSCDTMLYVLTLEKPVTNLGRDQHKLKTFNDPVQIYGGQNWIGMATLRLPTDPSCLSEEFIDHRKIVQEISYKIYDQP